MKNLLMVICFLIPSISFSQVVFNSNGNIWSVDKEDFPDELYREDTRFVLDKNTIKIGKFEYRITKVLKEKSFLSNSIIVEVALISNNPKDYDIGADPLATLDQFEVYYDMSDKIKYILTMDIINYGGSYREYYVKYAIGTNFIKKSTPPSVKW